MTVLGECFLFTAVLSIAACLSTKAYDPRTVTILPSSPCDSAFCYDATVSRVGNISNDARASPRDVPGLYLIPAKDLLLQVVQPERCFTACLSKVGLNSRNNWVRMIHHAVCSNGSATVVQAGQMIYIAGTSPNMLGA